MSVIVIGMEMPENCYDCPFVRVSWGNDYYCAKGNGTEDNIRVLMSKRMADCPLIEVPTPHGDLVDRTELLAEYDRQHKGPAGGARRIMEQATAVIKAEE